MKRAVGRFLAFTGAMTLIVPVVAASQTASPADAASASVTCDPQPTGGAATTDPLVSYTPVKPVRLVEYRGIVTTEHRTF